MIGGVLDSGDNFYEFNCDENEVNEFKEEVKMNASKISHVEYTSIYSEYRRKYMDANQIDNLKVEDAGCDKMGRALFKFSYDLREYPYLVTLIDRFMSGDFDSLYEIIFPDFNKEYIPAIDKINKEIEDLKITNHKHIDDCIDKINDLKEKLLDLKAGNIFIPSAEYYNAFLSLINLKVTSCNSLMLDNK